MSATQVSSPPVQPTVKATAPQQQKSRTVKTQSRPRKRAARRRPRGPSGIDSDEEIQREVASSDSDEDDDHDRSSSSDSATDDSDSEPGTDDVPASSVKAVAVAVDGVAVNGVSPGVSPPFFTNTWSEMVTDEKDNGTAAGLPVIDFAEFSGAAKIPPTRPQKKKRKKQKQATAAPTTQPGSESATAKPEPTSEESTPIEQRGHTRSVSSPLPRKFGQTARQAYQERLEKDPSYVPKVGGFWGHDDRLMDKELRSLSGWWRGQWQGRGRGRGRGFGMRGGAHGPHDARPPVDESELPPIERSWTHDGFEEMKKKEEEKQKATRGRGGVRGGRGGFAGRGRGGIAAPAVNSPAGSTSGTKTVGPRAGKVWFAMKPEAIWSKQAENFLFNDPSTKGPNPKFRVKIPGKEPTVAKGTRPPQSAKPASEESSEPTTTTQLAYVVRLPKKLETTKTPSQQPLDDAQESQGSQESQDAVPQASAEPSSSVATAAPAGDGSPSSQPSPAVVSKLEQLSIEPALSDPNRQALTAEAVLRNPGQATSTTEETSLPSASERPTLPPLQTVFTPTPPPPPVNHTSTGYGSPYTYPQPLPPGIGFNHHGMPYELATGRPVYLQAPPPPPMYNPQPLMHHHAPPAMSYGHVRHPSQAMSPDFLAQQPSHTPPMNGFIDPATGTPIFSFPRASARLEIRAPDQSSGDGSLPSTNGNGHAKSASVSQSSKNGPSKLRTTAAAFEPSSSHVRYPSASTPSDGSGLPPSYEAVNGVGQDGEGVQGHVLQPHQQAMGPPHMMYNPYAQQYYYPEAYGYPPYMEMGHGQGMYEGYGDPHGQQAAYY